MGVAHTIPNTSIEACLRIRNTRGTFHPEYARHAAAHSLIPSRFSPYVVHAKYSHPPTNAANRFLDGLTSIRSTFHRDHSARRVPRMFRPPPPPFIFNLDSLQRCLVTRDRVSLRYFSIFLFILAVVVFTSRFFFKFTWYSKDWFYKYLDWHPWKRSK